jgi:signal transduction histidine kinase
VPEAHRAQLFDSFFTTKPKGVGLGLSICKTIAAAHGGTLSYEHPAEGGSRFTLSLPLSFIG